MIIKGENAQILHRVQFSSIQIKAKVRFSSSLSRILPAGVQAFMLCRSMKIVAHIHERAGRFEKSIIYIALLHITHKRVTFASLTKTRITQKEKFHWEKWEKIGKFSSIRQLWMCLLQRYATKTTSPFGFFQFHFVVAYATCEIYWCNCETVRTI